MASYFSRPFGGVTSQFAQIANLMSGDSNFEPPKPTAKLVGSQSHASLPNAYDIYAKRKARRVEMQPEDYGDPGPVRDLQSSHDIAALYARRAQSRAEWTDKQIQFA